MQSGNRVRGNGQAALRAKMPGANARVHYEPLQREEEKETGRETMQKAKCEDEEGASAQDGLVRRDATRSGRRRGRNAEGVWVSRAE